MKRSTLVLVFGCFYLGSCGNPARSGHRVIKGGHSDGALYKAAEPQIREVEETTGVTPPQTGSTSTQVNPSTTPDDTSSSDFITGAASGAETGTTTATSTGAEAETTTATPSSSEAETTTATAVNAETGITPTSSAETASEMSSTDTDTLTTSAPPPTPASTEDPGRTVVSFGINVELGTDNSFKAWAGDVGSTLLCEGGLFSRAGNPVPVSSLNHYIFIADLDGKGSHYLVGLEQASSRLFAWRLDNCQGSAKRLSPTVEVDLKDQTGTLVRVSDLVLIGPQNVLGTTLDLIYGFTQDVGYRWSVTPDPEGITVIDQGKPAGFAMEPDGDKFKVSLPFVCSLTLQRPAGEQVTPDDLSFVDITDLDSNGSHDVVGILAPNVIYVWRVNRCEGGQLALRPTYAGNLKDRSGNHVLVEYIVAQRFTAESFSAVPLLYVQTRNWQYEWTIGAAGATLIADGPYPGSVTPLAAVPPPTSTTVPPSATAVPPAAPENSAIFYPSISELNAKVGFALSPWFDADSLFATSAASSYCRANSFEGGVIQEWDERAEAMRAKVLCTRGGRPSATNPNPYSFYDERFSLGWPGGATVETVGAAHGIAATQCGNEGWSGLKWLPCSSLAHRYCQTLGSIRGGFPAAGGMYQQFNSGTMHVLCMQGDEQAVYVPAYERQLNTSCSTVGPYQQLHCSSFASRLCEQSIGPSGNSPYRGGIMQEFDMSTGNAVVLCIKR